MVLLAVTIVGLVATFGMNFQILVPPLAQTRSSTSGAAGYGFLMAASGLGSILSPRCAVAFGRDRARP